LLLFTVGMSAESPAQTYTNSISVFGSYTTSSKLFHHPFASDDLLRGSYLPLDNILSGGADLRHTIDVLRIRIGLSAEIISTETDFSIPADSAHTIPGTDGFTAIPLELSGYFSFPVGSDVLHLYMGGGGGMYIGSRRYTYAGAVAPSISRKPGFGIQVLTGFEYDILPRVTLRSELKFRDIQFETSNQFGTTSTIYQGMAVVLNQEPFSSKIHIDGITLHLGVAVNF
jgi:hypothetical protein